ncbi:AMP-binding protein [Ideonella sp.]|uniref:AMP-binding protein n=1 Tax=Ideonella sp. TaxID=1929293 RepID=UPI002B47B7FC|nr:AMP-binding protein [Ideonella sp.]HJV72174.1 AMP-binding protein [Ideonella sp.]
MNAPGDRFDSALLPLWAQRELDAPLAWRAGVPVSGRRFLADVATLAAGLPGAARIVNLCTDRYHFAVAMAAAWSRGLMCLLPPNALPETLAALDGTGLPPHALVDDMALAPAGGMPWQRVDEVLATVKAHGEAPVPCMAPDGELACLLTSGSTGRPQPHVKRWGPLLRNIAAEAERLSEAIGQPDLRGLTLVASVPPQHSYGLESTVLLALIGGAALDSGRPFYPADMADALARVPRPRALVTTPFHLKTLLLSGVALPPVDLVLSATAPLSPQLALQAEQAFGGVLVEIYGCTEAGQVASRRTSQGQTWRTLGELRLHSERRADGEEVFIVQGGHVTEPTPLADVLQLEDARHFQLLGRANDLIHVAGKRSSLGFLNFQLNRLPGVEDGCFWMPDEVVEGVVRPIAFVVAPELTAAQVIAGLRGLLEAAFVPRKVVHVTSLPREATGKLTAQSLRAFAQQHLPAAEAARRP